MELQHSFTVPATVEQTWDTFMDLELVGGCFPGATVTEVNDDGFAGTVKVKLGPIALVYSGTGSFVQKDETAHTAVIQAKGKDKRGNGTAGATVTIALSEDGPSTRADVRTDLAVTGKPAQFGRGVMQDVSDKLLGQFIGCIEGKLGDVGAAVSPAAEAEPAGAALASSAPSEAAVAPGEGSHVDVVAPAAASSAPSGDPSTPSAASSTPVGWPEYAIGWPEYAIGWPVRGWRVWGWLGDGDSRAARRGEPGAQPGGGPREGSGRAEGRRQRPQRHGPAADRAEESLEPAAHRAPAPQARGLRAPPAPSL